MVEAMMVPDTSSTLSDPTPDNAVRVAARTGFQISAGAVGPLGRGGHARRLEVLDVALPAHWPNVRRFCAALLAARRSSMGSIPSSSLRRSLAAFSRALASETVWAGPSEYSR